MMPQECRLAFVYLTGVLYVAGPIYFLVVGEPVAAVFWLIGFPLAYRAYTRVFPSISQLLGYGRVDDVPAPRVSPSSRAVTMYSSFGCPFCPIVEERLRALETEMGFDLEHVDVTLRPNLVREKKIRSVPVVEVDDRRLVGHATTRELAELIKGAHP